MGTTLMGKISNKIVDLDYASACVIEWRLNQACSIAFTYGCFDLLHEGHKHMLYNASYYGHKLIVGINTDTSVTRLKGEGRPVQPLSVRAYEIASLPFVDLVVPFKQKTPYVVVKRLMPDTMIKGGEFRPGELIGRDYVINIETIPKIHDISTSKLIESMGLPNECRSK